MPHRNVTPAAVERAQTMALSTSTCPENTKAVVRNELESELRGLLMACRMHGFALVCDDGKFGIAERVKQ